MEGILNKYQNIPDKIKECLSDLRVPITDKLNQENENSFTFETIEYNMKELYKFMFSLDNQAPQIRNRPR